MKYDPLFVFLAILFGSLVWSAFTDVGRSFYKGLVQATGFVSNDIISLAARGDLESVENGALIAIPFPKSLSKRAPGGRSQVRTVDSTGSRADGDAGGAPSEPSPGP